MSLLSATSSYVFGTEEMAHLKTTSLRWKSMLQNILVTQRSAKRPTFTASQDILCRVNGGRCSDG